LKVRSDAIECEVDKLHARDIGYVLNTEVGNSKTTLHRHVK